MKDYNEIVRDVLRRSAEEEKENRKKKRMLVQLGSAAACCCLIVAAAAVLRHRNPGNALPDPAASTTGEPKQDTPANVHKGDGEVQNQPQSGGSSGRNDAQSLPAEDGRTVISEYGGWDANCYATPGNGTVGYSMPLEAAMDHYGDDVLYRVIIQMFRDSAHLPDGGEAARAEAERLSALGYDAMVVHSDETSHDYLTVCATRQQLEALPASVSYGYMLFLSGELVGGSGGSGDVQPEISVE